MKGVPPAKIVIMPKTKGVSMQNIVRIWMKKGLHFWTESFIINKHSRRELNKYRGVEQSGSSSGS